MKMLCSSECTASFFLPKNHKRTGKRFIIIRHHILHGKSRANDTYEQVYGIKTILGCKKKWLILQGITCVTHISRHATSQT